MVTTHADYVDEKNDWLNQFYAQSKVDSEKYCQLSYDFEFCEAINFVFFADFRPN